MPTEATWFLTAHMYLSPCRCFRSLFTMSAGLAPKRKFGERVDPSPWANTINVTLDMMCGAQDKNDAAALALPSVRRPAPESDRGERGDEDRDPPYIPGCVVVVFSGIYLQSSLQKP